LIGECVLGRVLVAHSAVGVCAILIGSDAEDLKNDLAKRFQGQHADRERASAS
jgi:methylated-DNA-[protein]-cysteine S-methyltransferase/AraC family transcriptional regulator of adaptative response/methylated-DNA-[protein]-cysteine methyltransferase